MSDAKTKRDAELTPEEVAAQRGEPLPDREVMSTIQTDPFGLPSIDGEPDTLMPTDPTPKDIPRG